MIDEKTDELGVKLHSTMDAQIWAEEFMKINGDDMSDVDESTMRSWFANALMAGNDIAHQKLNEKAGYLWDKGDITQVVECKEYFDKWFTSLLLSNISHGDNSRKPHPLGSCAARDVIRDRHVKNAMYMAFEKADPYGCFPSRGDS